MLYPDLVKQESQLQAELAAHKQYPYLQNVWIGSCRPGGNARGNVATQYQLRSRAPIFNGKKSRYIKPAELATIQAQVERGRRIAQLERQLLQVQTEIERLTAIAQRTGLALPKLTSFAALTQSNSNEWYTPSHYVDRARQALGGISLDPASNPLAQTWIQAATYYTSAEDGFNQVWFGTVWLNPPYGTKKPTASDWMLKAIAEYQAGRVTAAILLVRGDSRGIKQLAHQYPCCLPSQRIAF